MERSAAHSLVATFLRQRSEKLKACEMVIELKGKRLKPRVVAVGVASNQQELASASRNDGGYDGSGGGIDGALGSGVIGGGFHARLYIFKEDATGKRLLLHSSFELRRLEAVTYIQGASHLVSASADGDDADANHAMKKLDSDVFDDDSIGIIFDFKNASPMTFSFESQAQREAIGSSVKRLIRTYGSIEQRQTILGTGAGGARTANKRSAAATAAASTADELFGDGEKVMKAKLEELKQDKQHGFGASDQKLLMAEMAKVASRLVRGGVSSTLAASTRPTRGGAGRFGGADKNGGGGGFGLGRRTRKADAEAAVVRLFDDPYVFHEHLVDKTQRTELRVIRNMLSTDAVRSWEDISLQAQLLGGEVENIQDRIETYASHISGRKNAIEEIEHNIINSHRKERNFSLLHSKMDFIHQTLSLGTDANKTIAALEATNDVVTFLSQPRNAQILCGVMRETDNILHHGLVLGETSTLAPAAEVPVGAPASATAPSTTSVAVEKEYPLVAVVERKRYFVQLRRIVCRKSKLFANCMLEALFRQLWGSKERYSKGGRLVLQPHREVYNSLNAVGALIVTLYSADTEGYTNLLRQYRSHMQRVYSRELVAFFDALRKCVRRLGWQQRSKNSGKKGTTNTKGVGEQLRGPSLLGNSNNKLTRNNVFTHWTETNETSIARASEAGQGGGGGLRASTPTRGVPVTPMRPPLYGASPAPVTPAGYTKPSGFDGADDDVIEGKPIYSTAGGNDRPPAAKASVMTPRGGRAESVGGSSNGNSRKTLSVQLPELHMAGVLLHTAECAQEGISAAARAFAHTSKIGKSVDLIKGEDGGGFMRPDIAFGMALEATIDLILSEERSLSNIFGLYAPYMSGPGPRSANKAAVPPAAPQDRLPMPPHEIAFNLQSSLRELFGGSTTIVPSKGVRRRAVLAKDENPFADEDAPSSVIAKRKRQEQLATNASADWRAFAGDAKQRERPLVPKGVDIDSDYVSSEGEGSDSDDSDDDEKKSTKESKKLLLERNVAKEQLYRLTRKLVKTCDRVYVPAMLCMVEAMLGITHATVASPEALPRTTNSKAQTSYLCVNILCKLHKKLTSAFERHLREQTRSIVHCAHKFIERPEALLPCFAHLPLLIARLDATHEALDPQRCAHHHHYDTLLLTLVDHCFDVLDQLSHVKAIGSSSSTGVSLLTMPAFSGRIAEVTKAKLGMTDNEPSAIPMGTMKEVKRGFLMQLRHNAHFCYMYNALPFTSHARVLLLSRFERCRTMRDRYEELYLTRTIFAEEMPEFSRFINMCTELITAYTINDLVHSKALSRDRMEEILSKLDKEILGGLKGSAGRVKRHFTRDVGIDSADETFHRQLLKSVWAHYVAMIKNKIDFLHDLLKWDVFKGLSSPLASRDIDGVIEDML